MMMFTMSKIKTRPTPSVTVTDIFYSWKTVLIISFLLFIYEIILLEQKHNMKAFYESNKTRVSINGKESEFQNKCGNETDVIVFMVLPCICEGRDKGIEI